MKPKTTAYIFRVIIILLALCGGAVTKYLYPFLCFALTSGVRRGVDAAFYISSVKAQLIFLQITAIPAFILLIMAWRVSCAVRKNEFFTKKVLKTVRLATLILLIDLVIYIAGNTVFAIMNWDELQIVYFFIAAVVLVVTGLLWVLSVFIEKAVGLQEEVDLTV